MLGSGLPRKPGNICIVMDDRIPRERTSMLNRVINSLRTFTTVDTLGETTSEDMLLQKLQSKPYDLVLLPVHYYLAWKRVEAFWGLTRTSGPATAGYFSEPLDVIIMHMVDHPAVIGRFIGRENVDERPQPAALDRMV